jgi:phthiocerol/phenolphthiocerol synthesis type-I polyketide synthase C
LQASGRIDGILHLAGFSSSIDPAAPPDFNCARHQAHRCTVAAQAARACEETETDTTLWTITNGAARHLMPDNEPLLGHIPHLMPDDSVLYGFARTMMNETSHYTVRSMDITLPLNGMADLVDAIINELEQADDEQEVIFGPQGERFVPRLRVAPPAEESTATHSERRPGDAETVTLGFQFPGQLRNLRWETRPHQPPLETDEVEIQVHATGLNFRDVMYSLGLLSDEAVENGFAGASLGLEFCRRHRTNRQRIRTFLAR